MPWFENAIIYNVKAQPTTIESKTGSAGKSPKTLIFFIFFRSATSKDRSESALQAGLSKIVDNLS